jgi:hypothetical protein
MNKSYFTDEEEDQNELLLFIVNNLFDCFSLIKLEKLSDILDERRIISLVNEM